MISSILITIFSLVLLVYWFRYTCLLILRTKTSRDYSTDVVIANRLKFPEIQSNLLQDPAGAHLDPLHKSLAHDYRLLTYLLRHTAEFQVGGFTLEQRMLIIDFKLMQAWYAIARKFAIPQARKALEEMTNILSHFANAMGERSATATRV
jgi:hypothetical protein